MDDWPTTYHQAASIAAARRAVAELDHDDLYQLAAERLARQRPDPQQPGLCITIAKAAVTDYYRSHGPWTRNAKRPRADHVPVDWDEERALLLLGAVVDVAEQVADADLHHRRSAWLRRKATTYAGKRGEVLRRHLAGQSTAQIAQDVGMRDPNNVHVALTHLRALLRQAARVEVGHLFQPGPGF